MMELKINVSEVREYIKEIAGLKKVFSRGVFPYKDAEISSLCGENRISVKIYSGRKGKFDSTLFQAKR